MIGWLLYPLVFILGAIVGSFLNVVILRYNTGLGLKGRSHCLSCRAELEPIDLVPIVSFFFNKTKCRFCESKVSWQYPLVEAITGLIFALLAWRFPGEVLIPVFFAVASSLLIVITVYDYRHQIIPDDFVYAFIGIGFLGPVVKGIVVKSLALMVIGVLHGILAGGLFFLIFGGIWYFSKGRWIGFGDAKLVLGIGALLGLAQGVTALFIGFWIGAIVGLLLLLGSRVKIPVFSRYFNLKSEIAFAPFLVAGTLITIIFNLNVFPF